METDIGPSAARLGVSTLPEPSFAGFCCKGCGRIWDTKVSLERHKTHFYRRGTDCAVKSNAVELRNVYRSNAITGIAQEVPLDWTGTAD